METEKRAAEEALKALKVEMSASLAARDAAVVARNSAEIERNTASEAREMLLVFSGTSWGFAPYGRYVDFSKRLWRRCSNDCMLDLDLAMPLPLATPLPADGIDRTFPCHNEYKAKGTKQRRR